jgi:hypothetical protein
MDKSEAEVSKWYPGFKISNGGLNRVICRIQ